MGDQECPTPVRSDSVDHELALDEDYFLTPFRRYFLGLYYKMKVNSRKYWLISPYFMLASLFSGLLSLFLSASLNLSENFHEAHHHYYMTAYTYLSVTGGFLVEVALIRTVFVGCGGSGIPAAMILYHKDPDPLGNVNKFLSFRILIGKFLLTWFTLWLGGSAGKEGPTSIISGSVFMIVLSLYLRFIPSSRRQFHPKTKTELLYVRLALAAGAGSGIAAAFNTILGGFIFAVEEFTGYYDPSFGRMLTISVAGSVASFYGFDALINSQSLSNYLKPFYGEVKVVGELYTGNMLYISIINGVALGLLGGLNAQALLLMLEVKAWTARKSSHYIYLWALVSSVLFVALASNVNTGDAFAATVYGNGDKAVIQALNGNTYCGPNKGADYIAAWYGVAKATATILTYLSGTCGGIFAPTFSTASGWATVMYCGVWAPIQGSVEISFCIITGVSAYFSGFTGSPMTTFALITGMVYLNGTAEEQMLLKAGSLISSIVASHVATFITPVKLYERMSHILIEGFEKDVPAPESSWRWVVYVRRNFPNLPGDEFVKVSEENHEDDGVDMGHFRKEYEKLRELDFFPNYY